MTPNGPPLRLDVRLGLGLAEFLVEKIGYTQLPAELFGQTIEVPRNRRQQFLRELRVARASLRRGHALTQSVPRHRARSGLRAGRPRRRSGSNRCRAPAGDSEPHLVGPSLAGGGS